MSALQSTCFLCGKQDSGSTAFCDCDKANASCSVCADQLHWCQDCGVSYCGACFYKREHNLCTSPDKFHPDHLPGEALWCRRCALSDLLGMILVGAIVGERLTTYRQEGWSPDPDCPECKGAGWSWATCLVADCFSNQHPSACPCSF